MRWPPEPPIGPRRPARPGRGCAAALLLLAAAFVLLGHGVFRRGVRLAAARAAQRLEASLPPGLEAQRRERIVAALRRAAGGDGPEAAARLLGVAARVLEDGRLDPGEVEELEAVLVHGEASP